MAELENIIGNIMSSPESIGRIMDVVKLFGGEERDNEKERDEPSLPQLPLGDMARGMDPELISKLMGLLNEYNADDKRIRLLLAMRPYIKETDGFHIDRAIRIVKLAHVAKSALESFLK